MRMCCNPLSRLHPQSTCIEWEPPSLCMYGCENLLVPPSLFLPAVVTRMWSARRRYLVERNRHYAATSIQAGICWVGSGRHTLDCCCCFCYCCCWHMPAVVVDTFLVLLLFTAVRDWLCHRREQQQSRERMVVTIQRGLCHSCTPTYISCLVGCPDSREVMSKLHSFKCCLISLDTPQECAVQKNTNECSGLCLIEESFDPFDSQSVWFSCLMCVCVCVCVCVQSLEMSYSKDAEKIKAKEPSGR